MNLTFGVNSTYSISWAIARAAVYILEVLPFRFKTTAGQVKGVARGRNTTTYSCEALGDPPDQQKIVPRISGIVHLAWQMTWRFDIPGVGEL